MAVFLVSALDFAAGIVVAVDVVVAVAAVLMVTLPWLSQWFEPQSLGYYPVHWKGAAMPVGRPNSLPLCKNQVNYKIKKLVTMRMKTEGSTMRVIYV